MAAREGLMAAREVEIMADGRLMVGTREQVQVTCSRKRV
jgi:hypothetical protein